MPATIQASANRDQLVESDELALGHFNGLVAAGIKIGHPSPKVASCMHRASVKQIPRLFLPPGLENLFQVSLNDLHCEFIASLRTELNHFSVLVHYQRVVGRKVECLA